MAGPGARKPSVGEGKESSQPLVCSALVYFLFFFISAPILACEIIMIIIIIIIIFIAPPWLSAVPEPKSEVLHSNALNYTYACT